MTVIEINTDSIKDNFDISSIVQNIIIIPLKEQSGSYIGEVSKVFKLGKFFVVFDRLRSKRIVVFGNDGSFIAKPTDVGRSLNDPQQLNDCWINQKNMLEVYDFSTKKIFKYNREFKLQSIMQSKYDRVFTALLNNPDGGYLGYKGFTPYNSERDKENYKLATLRSDLAMDAIFMQYDNTLNDALLPNTNTPLQNIDGEVIIVQTFINSIMAVQQNELYEKYRILYSRHPLIDIEKNILIPNSRLLRDKNPDFMKIHSLFKGFFGFDGGWCETKNFIIIQSFDPSQKIFYSIYDKRHRKIVCNAYNLAFDGGKSVLPPFMTTSFKTDEFIAIYPGYILKPLIPKNRNHWNTIKENMEANYVINLTLK